MQSLVNYSFKNKSLIEIADNCGCYHCCELFKSTEVKNYTDDGKTALCPKCNIDAVLGDKNGFDINKEFLIKAKKYWF